MRREKGGGEMSRKKEKLLETLAKLIAAVAMLMSAAAALIEALK